MFVVQELDISEHYAVENLLKWYDQEMLEPDEESGKHFLEEYLFDYGDPEIWLDYDAYELDSELYTLLRQPIPAGGSIFTYFADAHPLVEPTIYIALNPFTYLNILIGKINPEPDYVTHEAFDLLGMKFGKFTYTDLMDNEDEEISKLKKKSIKNYKKKICVGWIQNI